MEDSEFQMEETASSKAWRWKQLCGILKCQKSKDNTEVK